MQKGFSTNKVTSNRRSSGWAIGVLQPHPRTAGPTVQNFLTQWGGNRSQCRERDEPRKLSMVDKLRKGHVPIHRFGRLKNNQAVNHGKMAARGRGDSRAQTDDNVRDGPSGGQQRKQPHLQPSRRHVAVGMNVRIPPANSVKQEGSSVFMTATNF